MVLMCMPYASMTEEYAAQLENYATVITVIFQMEMVLKLFGMGCSAYWCGLARGLARGQNLPDAAATLRASCLAGSPATRPRDPLATASQG